MEIALCESGLSDHDSHSLQVDTSTRISSMEIALWLQSVAVMD